MRGYGYQRIGLGVQISGNGSQGKDLRLVHISEYRFQGICISGSFVGGKAKAASQPPNRLTTKLPLGVCRQVHGRDQGQAAGRVQPVLSALRHTAVRARPAALGL